MLSVMIVAMLDKETVQEVSDMGSILKNPFFIAFAAAAVVGSACGILVGPNTTDIGQALVVGGTFMLFALIPTSLVAFLVSAFRGQSEKLKAEQAVVPKEVLRKRYGDQMFWSLVWAIAGIVITVITYIVAQNTGGSMYIICTGAIVFGFLSFLQGLFGWFRNR